MMTKIPNLKNFSSLFLVLIGIHLCVFVLVPEKFQQYPIFYAHLLLFGMALILDFILNKVKKIDETQVGKAFMAVSIFKMLFSLVFLLPWILNKDDSTYSVIIQFFILYFIYQIAEALLMIRSYLSK